MKSMILTLVALLLVSSTVKAADDFDFLAEEMMFSDNQPEIVPADSENGEKTGIFGFISKFFSGKEDAETAEDDGKKETFAEKSERMAQEGDVEAQMNLAYMYLYGVNGVETDYEKSAKYYAMAAEQDNPIALNNLGSLYFNGIGVSKDIRTALGLFQKSADLGNENAALNLAFIYLSGGKKDAERNRRAVDLLQKAQAKSHIAQFMLGYAYYQGFVVPQNYEKAFALIKKAASAESQIDEAQLLLAQMYQEGFGTVQNYQNALDSYRSAAIQGNIEAIMTLAEVYANGVICPQNVVMSHALLNVAAAHGVPNAAKLRNKLVKNANMNLEMQKQAQSIAQEYKASASELTNYIRQTYGTNIRSYIDNNMVLSVQKNSDL